MMLLKHRAILLMTLSCIQLLLLAGGTEAAPVPTPGDLMPFGIPAGPAREVESLIEAPDLNRRLAIAHPTVNEPSKRTESPKACNSPGKCNDDPGKPGGPGNGRSLAEDQPTSSQEREVNDEPNVQDLSKRTEDKLECTGPGEKCGGGGGPNKARGHSLVDEHEVQQPTEAEVGDGGGHGRGLVQERNQ